MNLEKMNANCRVGLFVDTCVLEEIKIYYASSRNFVRIVI